jgi:hypothetical protein
MRNIVELRNELASLFDDLKSGKIERNSAAEMNNSAGKIINSLKVELEYSALRKDKRKIEFLED